MNQDAYQTDSHLQQHAFQLLSHQLGISNFIRFIQHYEQGSGDYSLERESWQADYCVDSLAAEIAQWKEDQQKGI